MPPRRSTALARATLALLSLLAAAAQAQGRVAPAGALKLARIGHSATLLDDGRVLVVGGRGVDPLSTLADAELFDPKSGKWTAAAPATEGRTGHSATLLKDGRVLVCGGATHQGSAFVALASAELFDPKRGQWRPLPPLAQARQGHAAVLLPDGRVLVAGGAQQGLGALATTELFDPKTERWTAGPRLTTPRVAASGLLVSDAAVFVAGRALDAQAKGSLALPSVERCTAEACAPLATLTEARQRHAAVATLDGGVLVLGGLTAAGMTNYVELVAAGLDGGAGLDAVHLPQARAGHSATALKDGAVVVVGGETPTTVDTASVLLKRRAGEAFCEAGRLAVPRKGHTATLLRDGSVLVVGGTTSGLAEASAERWQPTPGACPQP